MGTHPGTNQNLDQTSESDQVSILSANGVSDPGKWAEIVKNAGPYPSGAAGEQKLRQVLAQFKADPADTAKIINAVTP
jgi:hypothetical protein